MKRCCASGSSRNASWPYGLSISAKRHLGVPGRERVDELAGLGASGTASRSRTTSTSQRTRRPGERVGERVVALGQVEVVHRLGHVEVRVGVEALGEALALVGEVALDLELVTKSNA